MKCNLSSNTNSLCDNYVVEFSMNSFCAKASNNHYLMHKPSELSKPIKRQLLQSVSLEQVLDICEQNKQFLVGADAAIALHRIAKFSERHVLSQSSGTLQIIRDLETGDQHRR